MTGRVHAALFVALCTLGAVAAVALTAREVARTAPVALAVTAEHRTGDTTDLTVSVRNTTARARCVTVQVAARDREGHDLAAVTAVRALPLPAHARRAVHAGLTLTPREYAEQLDAFYPSATPCESAG